MQVLLDNVKQVGAGHVEDGLAARDGHDLALDLEDGLAASQLDLEAVARQGHDLFAQDQRLGLARDEVVEDGHLARRGGELEGGGHCGCDVVM